MRRPLLGALALALAATAGAEEIFVDRARDVGLVFEHENGTAGKYYFCEPVGSGGALFDFDGDGDLDVYLVQGQKLDGAPDPALTDRLYRNELDKGSLAFVDVTAASGIRAPGYGMGVATGDYDNDGRTDLYVTNLGSNQLWRNLGGGRFEDATAAAGADDDRWSVSATFVDYDRDGWLDLYVTNYVDFTLATHKACRTKTGAPGYCGPLAYNSQPDRLFRNRGAGADGRVTFERATEATGVAAEYGSGLGVATADFNGDGWIDLYIANDQKPNQMWINRGPGGNGRSGGPGKVTFENEAMLAGTALNAEGIPEASMGIAVGDVDGDGDEDLILSHLDRETNTLYLNEGDGFFEDATSARGLAAPSWKYTSFGIGWVDYDNNGWLDLIAANGAIKGIEHLVRQGDPYPLHQPNQLYRNLGGDGGAVRFAEVTAEAGKVFELSEVSRGVAVGDVDNDGDGDVLVTNNRGPVRLLVNRVGQDRAWLGVRAVGRMAGPREGRGRDMLDALVGVERPGKSTLWQRVRTGGSYASARDPRVLFGLGEAKTIGKLHVVWPDGRKEEHDVEGIRRYVTLRQPAAEAPGAGSGGSEG